MNTIIPNIWCQGTADEMAEFYCDAFALAPGGTEIVAKRNYPEEGLLDFQKPLAGKTLTIQLRLGDLDVILINAGDDFSPNPSISIMVNFDPATDPHAAAHLEAMWHKLAPGGRVLSGLGAYPFSSAYGWVEDRFGVSWQLILKDPAGEPRPFASIAVLFPPNTRGDSAKAQQLWTSVFPDSARGTYIENSGRIDFSEFQLGGQWFTAMDSHGPDIDQFTPGFSLMYQAHAQEEIDRIWNALSAVKEAEQCGWLCDEFGVSWQIVPDTMEELLERPGAFTQLLGMKKIEISRF